VITDDRKHALAAIDEIIVGRRSGFEVENHKISPFSSVLIELWQNQYVSSTPVLAFIKAKVCGFCVCVFF
jgi:hypothetical protein